MLHPSTFSIVACDLNERAWGVAVASKFLAVGAVVPFAQAEAGAIATQSHANPTYGPKGLAMLAKLHGLYFGKSEPGERLKIAGEAAKELQRIMARLGFYAGAIHGAYDEATRAALRAFTRKENLEDRTFLDDGMIDPPALEYLRERFGLK